MWMKVHSVAIAGAAVAALAAPAAFAAGKPPLTVSHAKSVKPKPKPQALKPLPAPFVRVQVAALLPPALSTPTSNAADDASFSDSYFSPITIDIGALQTPPAAENFPVVVEQDGYLVQ
jgi:hypothetical protein